MIQIYKDCLFLFKVLLCPHQFSFSPLLLYHCTHLMVGLAVVRNQQCEKFHMATSDIWDIPVRTFDLEAHSGMIWQYLNSIPCPANRVPKWVTMVHVLYEVHHEGEVLDSNKVSYVENKHDSDYSLVRQRNMSTNISEERAASFF